MPDPLPDKLHLGCGLTTPVGWLNVDGSWVQRLARRRLLFKTLCALRLLPRSAREQPFLPGIFLHDLRKPLPFPDASFSAVFSSHTLEHLHLTETTGLLRECLRVLRPGGVARMLVPDLGALVREYQGGGSIPGMDFDFQPVTRADRFMRNMLVRHWEPPPAGLLRRVYAALTDFHSHKWMYDAESLTHHMRQAGFAEVSARSFLDSRIPGIDQVEKAERVLDGRGICVEGIKGLGA